MTGCVQPLADDLAHMPHDAASFCTTLRPLDFTNLSTYHDPVWAPTISPQNPWSSVIPNPWARIGSPLRSARRASPTIPQDSPLFSSLHPGASGSPLFASFSPLFKTPRAFKTSPAAPAPSDNPDPVSAPTHQPSQQELEKNTSAILHASPLETSVIHSDKMDEEKAPAADTQTTLTAVHPISQSDYTASSTQVTSSYTPSFPNSTFASDALVDQSPAKLELPTIAPPQLCRNVSTNLDVGGRAPKPSAKETAKADKSKVTRKSSQTMSSIDKAAERRRKNRESSSRCYYNRKRIIEI